MKKQNRLTHKGFEKLKEEYENLLYSKRPLVLKGISEAAAEGDRSENAEYIYGKKHLREIDRRLAYLAKLLENVEVIHTRSILIDRVCFGVLITVQDDSKTQKKFRIVGEGETDFYSNGISEKSPVAQALMGKQVGDVIEVHRPKGLWEVEILDISI